ncbi:MAG: TadE/TadG family type IV pilus assembly protein [Alphaproteobacteria bacterium]
MIRLSRIPFLRRLARFGRDQRGVAATEFAIIASVLTFALLGGTELSRYTLMHQKMDRVSASVSNMVAQSSTMKAVDFTNMWAAAAEIAKPFDMGGATSKVIISFIVAETNSNYRIQWQRSGAGTMAQVSKLGTEGGLATMPTGVTMKQGDTIVAVEVYATYAPFVFPEVVGSTLVYHRSFDQPRLVDLITLQ